MTRCFVFWVLLLPIWADASSKPYDFPYIVVSYSAATVISFTGKNGDAVCQAISDKISNSDGYQYKNGRFMVHPDYGYGCMYLLMDHGYSYGDVFYQNWVLPNWGCLDGYDDKKYGGGCSLVQDKLDELTYLSSAIACKSSGTPNGWVGNPIELIVGRKVQVELFKFSDGKDYKALQRLTYNSVDGLWSHELASRLIIRGNEILLVRGDGTRVVFDKDAASADFSSLSKASLSKIDDLWRYEDAEDNLLYFDADGSLVKITNFGVEYSVLVDGLKVSAFNQFGDKITIETDSLHQPLKIYNNDQAWDLHYNADGHLAMATLKSSEKLYSREYHYEDPRDPKLLTGITDERGVRYATWSYDDQGRAISSEHAGGAEKVTLAYNDDGSTTVTNVLGKQTTYRFQVIQGVKRITAIEGEPAADCPAANSTYTYNDRGQVLTATDAEGRVTRYAYNDRGLEISRVEGEGTAEARTVTTEWDPEQYRRIQVTADGRRTLYSYDDQGRLLSERTEAVSKN